MEKTFEECDHIYVRRRDGKWCMYCGDIKFGEELTEQDKEKLKKEFNYQSTN